MVQFHEVGAVDAIADICGVCLALDTLGVDDVVCSPLPVGRGFVQAAHGRLPLPAPATLEILREAGAPLEPLELRAELVTPTGAALVAALASRFGSFPALTPRAVGYGAGTRDLEEVPNVVRVVLGRPRPERRNGRRAAGRDQSRRPLAGARPRRGGGRDRRRRPRRVDDGRADEEGPARASCCRRWPGPPTPRRWPARCCGTRARWGCGSRRTRAASSTATGSRSTSGGAVRVKRGWLNGELVNVAPEHDDCAAVARSTGRPVKEVWARALTAAGTLGHDHPHPEGDGHGHDHR